MEGKLICRPPCSSSTKENVSRCIPQPATLVYSFSAACRFKILVVEVLLKKISRHKISTRLSGHKNHWESFFLSLLLFNHHDHSNDTSTEPLRPDFPRDRFSLQRINVRQASPGPLRTKLAIPHPNVHRCRCHWGGPATKQGPNHNREEGLPTLRPGQISHTIWEPRNVRSTLSRLPSQRAGMFKLKRNHTLTPKIPLQSLV